MLNVGVFKFLYLIVSLIKKSIKRIFASWKVRTLLVPLLMRMTLDHIDRIRYSFVCVFVRVWLCTQNEYLQLMWPWRIV